MNGRRIIWMTLLALGAVAVLAATSALADPPDIGNPPTEDWFFDSGNTVTISNKVWNINYNITVANYTHLVFDSCTFTFSDPDEIYQRWIHVWWNGTMSVKGCTFSSTGTVRYFMVFENITMFENSALSGLRAPDTSMGGITVIDSDISFVNVTVRDSTGGYGVYINNGELMARGSTFTGCGHEIYWRGAVMVDNYMSDWDATYGITIIDCHFDNNLRNGLRMTFDGLG